MKVTTQELERCEILMTIEADSAQEQDLLQKAARRISREVQIPGFRPGKAPYNTVLRRFGLDLIRQEAWEHAAEKIVTDALEQAELNPQAPVQLDEEVTWEPLTVKVRVPGPAKIELGAYRDIRLEVEPIVVTDDDVAQALKELQDKNATWTPVERPAELNDLITMSVVEKDGDSILNQSEAVEYELAAPAMDEEQKAQPDFTTPLLGLSAGDSKTFAIAYPESWPNQNYSGKEISFEVQVSSVKVKELDPLDDEFAKSIGDVETLAELEQQLRKNIEERRQSEYNNQLGQQTLDKIIETADLIEWPAALEESRLDQEIETYEERLKQAGLTLESYLNMQNITAEELREQFREGVVKGLKMGLVLDKLAQLEGLQVSQGEVLERARAISDLAGGDNRIWEGILTSPRRQATVANNLLVDKIFDRLAAIAKGESPALEAKVEAAETGEQSPLTEDKPAEAESAAT